jgi:hypothetical protein
VRSKFNVTSACGKKRSHKCKGKPGSADAIPATKRYLKFLMARSAALRLCQCGGTSWYSTSFSVKQLFNAATPEEPKIENSNSKRCYITGLYIYSNNISTSISIVLVLVLILVVVLLVCFVIGELTGVHRSWTPFLFCELWLRLSRDCNLRCERVHQKWDVLWRVLLNSTWLYFDVWTLFRTVLNQSIT